MLGRLSPLLELSLAFQGPAASCRFVLTATAGGGIDSCLHPLWRWHVLCAVRCCRARDAFRQWHQADAAAGRCIVIRYPTRDLELVLVPVMTKTGAG